MSNLYLVKTSRVQILQDYTYFNDISIGPNIKVKNNLALIHFYSHNDVMRITRGQCLQGYLFTKSEKENVGIFLSFLNADLVEYFYKCQSQN